MKPASSRRMLSSKPAEKRRPKHMPEKRPALTHGLAHPRAGRLPPPPLSAEPSAAVHSSKTVGDDISSQLI